MNELDKILDLHIKNVEQRFKKIPKSKKHTGVLALIQNKAENAQTFTKQADKIVNDELNTMLKHVNSKLVNKYTQKEVDKFTDKAREKFVIVLQNGLRNSFS